MSVQGSRFAVQGLNAGKETKEKIVNFVNYENWSPEVVDAQWLAFLTFFKITKSYNFGDIKPETTSNGHEFKAERIRPRISRMGAEFGLDDPTHRKQGNR